jgi:hypothetical protein
MSRPRYTALRVTVAHCGGALGAQERSQRLYGKLLAQHIEETLIERVQHFKYLSYGVTPTLAVLGGVGPMTIATLLTQTLEAAKQLAERLESDYEGRARRQERPQALKARNNRLLLEDTGMSRRHVSPVDVGRSGGTAFYISIRVLLWMSIDQDINLCRRNRTISRRRFC